MPISEALDRSDPVARAWVDEAVRKVEADANRSADTHPLAFPMPAGLDVDLYLEDESTHPTGSFEHRPARSLVLYRVLRDERTSSADPDAVAPGSRIGGIGPPQVEPSFVPSVVVRMVRVPDAASIAATRFLREVTGLRAGGSTGTNLWAALETAAAMTAAGEPGSVVTLLCDSGERWLPRRVRRAGPWLDRPAAAPAGVGPGAHGDGDRGGPGQSGSTFAMLKFRSMVVDVDRRRAELQARAHR